MISLHILRNLISSHNIPLQIFFCVSLLFFFCLSSNYNSNCLFNQYLPTLFIITLFIVIPYLLFVITLFVVISTSSSSDVLFQFPLLLPPFIIILVTWHKWWIITTHIFLKSNTTSLAHLKSLNFLSTSTVRFLFWISVPKKLGENIYIT